MNELSTHVSCVELRKVSERIHLGWFDLRGVHSSCIDSLSKFSEELKRYSVLGFWSVQSYAIDSRKSLSFLHVCLCFSGHFV